MIGDRYPSDPLDCDAVELTYVHRVTGDKHGLLRTEVLRRFRSFRGAPRLRRRVARWNRMALEYRERHVNDVVVIKEYRSEGISSRVLELLVRAAPATRQFALEEARLPHRLGLGRRVRSHANYVRFSFHAGVGFSLSREAPSKVAWVVLLPVGLALYLRDLRRLR